MMGKQKLLDKFFRNFTNCTCTAILRHMAEQVNSTPPIGSAHENKLVDRPFRVKLRGSVLALVRLPNRRSVRAAFHQLSISGGIIHVEKPLDEKLEVELIFHIREATIRGKAQSGESCNTPLTNNCLETRVELPLRPRILLPAGPEMAVATGPSLQQGEQVLRSIPA